MLFLIAWFKSLSSLKHEFIIQLFDPVACYMLNNVCQRPNPDWHKTVQNPSLAGGYDIKRNLRFLLKRELFVMVRVMAKFNMKFMYDLHAYTTVIINILHFCRLYSSNTGV